MAEVYRPADLGPQGPRRVFTGLQGLALLVAGLVLGIAAGWLL